MFSASFAFAAGKPSPAASGTADKDTRYADFENADLRRLGEFLLRSCHNCLQWYPWFAFFDHRVEKNHEIIKLILCEYTIMIKSEHEPTSPTTGIIATLILYGRFQKWRFS